MLQQLFYSLGYSKIKEEFGTIFQLSIKDDRIIWGISPINQAIFNAGSLICKTDFKKRTIDLLSNKYPSFSKLEISDKDFIIVDMEYNILNLNLLLDTLKFIEEQDKSLFDKLKEQELQAQIKLKSICDFAKSQNIKLSKKTIQKIEADIGIVKCPSYELYTSATSTLINEIKNFKPKKIEKEIIITKEEQEENDFFEWFDKYSINKLYWEEIYASDIIDLINYEGGFIPQELKQEIFEQLKTFEEAEKDKKWSGDRKIFKEIREKLVSI